MENPVPLQEKLQVNHEEDLEAEKYDPYTYGNTNNPVSFTGAVIHVIKYTVGITVLTVPLVHKRLGYVIATCLTVFVGFLYFHIIHILIDVEYKLCILTRRPRLTFLQIIQVAFENVSPSMRTLFGPVTRLLVHMYYFIPIGNASGIIIMSSFAQGIIKFFFQIDLSLTQSINIMIIPTAFLSVCIRKIKLMVPFSAVTNIFTIITMGIILSHSFFTKAPKSEWQPINDVASIPQCFALMIDAFSGTGVYIPLKSEMRFPERFSHTFGVVNVAGSALVILYTFFGIVCYLNYGNDVQNNVILNLPDNSYLSVSVYAFFIPGIIVSHSLKIYTKCDIYWTGMLEPKLKKHRCQKAAEFGMRILFNLLTYIFAVYIPNFVLFSTILGTIGILCDLAVPPLLEALLLVHDSPGCNTRTFLTVGKNLVIVGVACVMFSTSAIDCVKDIFKL